jgi:hypothetical protein
MKYLFSKLKFFSAEKFSYSGLRNFNVTNGKIRKCKTVSSLFAPKQVMNPFSGAPAHLAENKDAIYRALPVKETVSAVPFELPSLCLHRINSLYG